MLTFNLKKEWSEKIKSGEKTHEYREVKPYWSKRLIRYTEGYESFPRDENGNFLVLNWRGEPFDLPIEFVCGYAGKDDKDKRLKALLKSITVCKSGKDTDLAIDKEVYDIEFELVKEGWEDV